MIRRNWPEEVSALYEQQEKDFERYSDNTQKEIEKGKAVALEEVAKNLLKDGMSVGTVARNTGLSEEQIKKWLGQHKRTKIPIGFV